METNDEKIHLLAYQKYSWGAEKAVAYHRPNTWISLRYVTNARMPGLWIAISKERPDRSRACLEFDGDVAWEEIQDSTKVALRFSLGQAEACQGQLGEPMHEP